ncbi:MAG: hypothetical protein IKV51_03250, partial [Clostridia bacterium]|nr:hypothetical protein [Clostridia bacterium]
MGSYHNRREALTRVRELARLYPDDPRVQELVRRASIANLKSKGDFLEISPEMVAYKKNEEALRERFRKLNQAEWQRMLAEKSPITAVFPTPDPPRVNVEEHYGKYVVLENVLYPNNQFIGMSGEYIHVGKPSAGYYFVDIAGRAWLGPYEAVKRYRRFVDASLGESISFTVLGKITGVVMESPDAGENKMAPASWGWIVQPEYLYAGERVMARYDANHENSGIFVGEEDVEKIKDGWYTVKSIPDNVDPKRLMEIFATAIKEKNFELYAQCIHPDRQRSDTGKSLLRYHWDLHQERFQKEYVHAVFDEPEITVIKGFAGGDDLDDFFMSAEQKSSVSKGSGEVEEMAIVMSRAYDQNGKQRGS